MMYLFSIKKRRNVYAQIDNNDDSRNVIRDNQIADERGQRNSKNGKQKKKKTKIRNENCFSVSFMFRLNYLMPHSSFCPSIPLFRTCQHIHHTHTHTHNHTCVPKAQCPSPCVPMLIKVIKIEFFFVEDRATVCLLLRCDSCKPLTYCENRKRREKKLRIQGNVSIFFLPFFWHVVGVGHAQSRREQTHDRR